MGVVYLARDVQLDHDVAFKVLSPHLARDPEARERFVREARMAAGLSHPHIVPIHRVSEATCPSAPGAAVGSHFVFVVMSYVEGETLPYTHVGEKPRLSSPGARSTWRIVLLVPR